jgi:hypothetical protein
MSFVRKSARLKRRLQSVERKNTAGRPMAQDVLDRERETVFVTGSFFAHFSRPSSLLCSFPVSVFAMLRRVACRSALLLRVQPPAGVFIRHLSSNVDSSPTDVKALHNKVGITSGAPEQFLKRKVSTRVVRMFGLCSLPVLTCHSPHTAVRRRSRFTNPLGQLARRCPVRSSG